MKTVVFAYHDPGCAGIEALLRAGIEVAAVFTHRDDPGENAWFGSVAEVAARHGIPVHAPEDPNHPIWVERIRRMEPDAIFSFYYRRLLGAEILAIPAAGAFNLHGSLLPRYRGRCPVNWAILNGERETGVTLHEMVAKPDAGAIVAQERVAIGPEDDARAVFAGVVAASERLLEATLPKLAAGTAERRPQDESQATTFGGRRPDDGEIDWSASAAAIHALVRAVAWPYPGAFTFAGDRKIMAWRAAAEPSAKDAAGVAPGTVLGVAPLRVATGDGGAIAIREGQAPDGVRCAGAQLAADLNLVPGMRLGPRASDLARSRRTTRVLILGVNGFIGSALSERLLAGGRHEVFGLDLRSDNIGHLLGRPGFEFREGDIAIHREWIEYHVRKCDVVLPLVAIATPIEYVRNPLRVFELDFEENLKIVRYCAKYRKRIIFPSTSEVYGMCEDPEFDEDASRLVLGPIRMQRWIYSCSKQLLDRVIWAYGAQQGLRFTLFRPFNWIGPRLDSLESARIGSSRAITQLILNLVEGTPIVLVDGGAQKRCFTDVSDGVECLFRIIENREDRCDGGIVNIGSPENEASIRELAEMLVAAFDRHPLRKRFPPFAGYREVESGAFYGKGYQDVAHRRPSIRNARRLVGWEPNVGLREAVEGTLDHFLREHVGDVDASTATVAVDPAAARSLLGGGRERATR